MIDRLIERTLGAAVIALGLALGLSTSGCNIIGPAAYIIQGPGTIDAAYELPNKPTVVFVDDRTNLLPRTSMRAELGSNVTDVLVDKGIITEYVNPREAINFVRNRERGDNAMSIAAIGRGLGVDQVVFLRIDSFALAPASGMPQPEATVAVKVIDLELGERMFPPGGPEALTDVYSLQSTLSDASPELYRSPSGIRELETMLIARMSIDVSKLFFEHERIEFGEYLNPR